jgi:hypothetical protein
MQLIKIENTILLGGWSLPAILWTVTIVASVLFLIFLVYSVFVEEPETPEMHIKKKLFQVETRNVLLFFTIFSWASTIFSYFNLTVSQLLLMGAIAGLIGVSFAVLAGRYLIKNKSKRAAFPSTGRVLESIPPHRNGIGKVYLNQSRTPLQLDAITIGRELPVGVPVRIVDMLDEHTAVVEPLDNGVNRIGNKDEAPV